MCGRSSGSSRFVLIVVAAAMAVPLARGEEPARDALDAYRAFLDALRGASTIEPLEPFMPSSLGEGIEGASQEERTELLQRMRAVSNGAPEAWERVAQKEAADRTRLVLRGTRREGGTQQWLEAEVEMVFEEGRWKLDHHSEWREVGVLPEALSPDASAAPLGPGASDAGTAAYDPADYRPQAQAYGLGETFRGSLVYDPRGHYVAVGGSAIRLFRVDTLELVWLVRTGAYPDSLTFRPDGRAVAALGGSRDPEVMPLAANLAERAEQGRYYFLQPVFPEVAKEAPDLPMWNDLAYHPREPILALALNDRADQSWGAIAFQPAGDGLWLPAERKEPTVSRLEEPAWSISWSPEGDRLAWHAFSEQPGQAIHVRSHPEAAAERTLSRADFMPLQIVFGPRGRLAAVGHLGEAMGVVIWDVATGAELMALPGIAQAAFASGGDHLLAARDPRGGSERGVTDVILVWPVGASEPSHEIAAFRFGGKGRAHVVSQLGVSPNGRFLVAVNEDGDVELWDASRPIARAASTIAASR